MSRAFRAALAAEILKARRSRVPVVTLLAVSAAGGVAALFMVILADPEQARRFGLLSSKANLSGLTADWPGLLTFLAQVVAVGDLLLFGFIGTWVFGREAVEGTMRYLLALPVPRAAIVLAKFTVVAVWSAATNAWLAALVVGCGALLDLPGGGADVVHHGLTTAGIAAGLMLLVTTPVALIASVGRGYLAPLASTVAALVLAQVAAALGRGDLLPWSVPAVAAGLAPDTELGATGMVVALVTGVTGVVATIAWWRSGAAGRG